VKVKLHKKNVIVFEGESSSNVKTSQEKKKKKSGLDSPSEHRSPSPSKQNKRKMCFKKELTKSFILLLNKGFVEIGF